MTTGIVEKELNIYLNKSKHLFDTKDVIENDYKLITVSDMYGLFISIAFILVLIYALFVLEIYFHQAFKLS